MVHELKEMNQLGTRHLLKFVLEEGVYNQFQSGRQYMIQHCPDFSKQSDYMWKEFFYFTFSWGRLMDVRYPLIRMWWLVYDERWRNRCVKVGFKNRTLWQSPI